MKILITGGDDILLVSKILGKDNELIAVYPQIVEYFKNMEIPCTSITSCINEDDKVMSSVAISEFMHDFVENIGFATKEMKPAIKTGFVKSAIANIHNNINDLSMMIFALDRADVDMALVHNDVEPLMRVIAMWCKLHGKPCIHVPHAIYLDYEHGAVGADIHDMVTASHLASAGPFQTKWYVERGMPIENIRMTGVPRFDRLYSLNLGRERSCNLLGLDPNKPIVTYFSSWRQDTNLLGCNDGVEESYGMFLDAAKDLPGVQLIVKTHPRGNNNQYHINLATEKGIKCIVTEKYLDIVLQATNVCLSYGVSNVMLEAAILGKTLISVNGFENDREVVTVKPDAAEIATAIIKGLSGASPRLDNFVLKYIGIPDGHSTERVVQFVRECDNKIQSGHVGIHSTS